MMPFLGQGGAMAFEDAFVLGKLLLKIPSYNKAQEKYNDLRPQVPIPVIITVKMKNTLRGALIKPDANSIDPKINIRNPRFSHIELVDLSAI